MNERKREKVRLTLKWRKIAILWVCFIFFCCWWWCCGISQSYFVACRKWPSIQKKTRKETKQHQRQRQKLMTERQQKNLRTYMLCGKMCRTFVSALIIIKNDVFGYIHISTTLNYNRIYNENTEKYSAHSHNFTLHEKWIRIKYTAK